MIRQRYRIYNEYEEYKGFVFINFGFVLIKLQKNWLPLVILFKTI